MPQDIEPAQTPESEPLPPDPSELDRSAPSTRDDEDDLDFITRHVLEKDSVFFEG